MDFSNEKYEFCLKTWGGFFNHEHKQKHGVEEGYHFFNTKAELKKYLGELKKIEQELNARILAYDIFEGKHVRYETIAKMVLIYKSIEYPFEYNFGFGYPVSSAYFLFENGNYSCDCNLSLFINRKYGDVIDELECGEEIEIKNFLVIQEKALTSSS